MNNQQMKVEVERLKTEIGEQEEYNELKKQLRELKYHDEILAYQKFKISAKFTWEQFLSWSKGFADYWFSGDDYYYKEVQYGKPHTTIRRIP